MSKNIYKKLLSDEKEKIADFCNAFALKIINGEASVFIGAGMSINSGIPSWQSLLSSCKASLKIASNEQKHKNKGKKHEDNGNVDLYKIAQYYANKYTVSSLRVLVYEQINNHYEPNDNLKALLKLNFKSIWTTNYDNLIEKVLDSRKIGYNVINNEKSLTSISAYNKINIYKINGDCQCPQDMVLTQADYEKYESTHPLFLTFLKKELVSNSFLFVGYSFNDRIVLDCLSSVMKMLDGNGAPHYALVYIDNSVTREIEYQADDLKKRYNIQCVFVSNKSLPTILQLLNNKVKQGKIFISGAYYDVSKKTDKFADNLSQKLVVALLKNGYRISTGVGRRLGTYITVYANQYLMEQSEFNPQKYLSMRPFPFHKDLTDEQKMEYRNFMQHDCEYAIFMFGQSKHEHGNGHCSEGVYQEFELAKKNGLKIIPIGSTGYEAKIIWKEVNETPNKYYYLSKKMDKLKNERDPQKLTDIILSILEAPHNN